MISKRYAILFVVYAYLLLTVAAESEDIEAPMDLHRHYQRSVMDFKQHIAQKDFDFKDDLIQQINQIMLQKKISAIERLLMPQVTRKKCIWRSMICREISTRRTTWTGEKEIQCLKNYRKTCIYALFFRTKLIWLTNVMIGLG